ncbi:hypothetical protein MTO96_014710 [Rhipicephalus appendiculatus]
MTSWCGVTNFAAYVSVIYEGVNITPGCVKLNVFVSTSNNGSLRKLLLHDIVLDRTPPFGPVLNLSEIPTLFEGKPSDVEPLPESPGLVDFLADLLRTSRSRREALDEAGMIIGFYSLALAVVVAKPVRHVEDFFWKQMKRALASAVPTSFDGDAHCPNGRFLTPLALKGHRGVVKPYIVLLVLGQYAYHVNNDAGPR